MNFDWLNPAAFFGSILYALVGVVLGTPEYLSPEQAIGARVEQIVLGPRRRRRIGRLRLFLEVDGLLRNALLGCNRPNSRESGVRI